MSNVNIPARIFPDAKSLMALEKETLKCIVHSSILQKIIPNTVKEASVLLSRFPTDQYNWHISLQAPYTRSKQRNVYCIYIGVNIQTTRTGEYEMVSYSVVICDELTPNKKIVRKFHFDYEPRLNPKEPKPILHIQYCGKMASYLSQYDYKNDHIAAFYPELEKPRIPAQPVCLGILLDWIFHEFWEKSDFQNMTKDNAWRKHIQQIEVELLHPYFKTCCEATKPSRSDTTRLYLAQLMYNI